jgi:hypothetical protein
MLSAFQMNHHKKEFKVRHSIVFAVALVSQTLSLSVNATIIDNGLVNGLPTFMAEHDNTVWLRLDAFE